MFGSDLMKLPGGTNWTRFMLPRKNWQILRYYHEIGKKTPVSRCHLQLTSATIKSTERPANQPTIEEEAFSPLASNSERGVCVCATAMFVMVASFTKCPCYSCYVENLISLKYSTVVMHCRWIDTFFLQCLYNEVVHTDTGIEKSAVFILQTAGRTLYKKGVYIYLTRWDIDLHQMHHDSLTGQWHLVFIYLFIWISYNRDDSVNHSFIMHVCNWCTAQRVSSYC